MIKIAIFVPYQEFAEPYEKMIRNMDAQDVEFEIRHVFGTTNEYIQQCCADIIIARGITCYAVSQANPQVHLVKIDITAYDILGAILECSKLYKAKSIGVITSKRTLCNIDMLESITGLSICVLSADNEAEIGQALQRGRHMGLEAFVGGNTGYNMGRRLGLQYVQIQMGHEAMERSLEDALNTARSICLERNKSTLIKKLLNNAGDGLIAVDSQGIVTEINKLALEIFGIPEADSPTGRTASATLPSGVWDTIREVLPNMETLCYICDRLYIVSATNIDDTSPSGNILYTIQNTEKIQTADKKIRKELRGKGFVAKYSLDDILGFSGAIRNCVHMAYKYGKADASVLIIGETGTGKELMAHSIHNASKRKEQPFVAINCAAVPENLLESELFGYEEGAFSGAIKGGRAGLFEQAHGGTIFLDEIGELTMSLQAKLLRALQEKEIRRVGGIRVIPVDVRVISATNSDLPDMVRDKKFRADLYYRLNLLELYVPPLRERAGDIETLAKYFIQYFCEKHQKRDVQITPQAVKLIREYEWPGNVRELRNVCERLVVLDESGVINEKTICGERFYRERYARADKPEQDKASDEDVVLAMLRSANISKSMLAKELGISRSTLWRKLKNDEKKEPGMDI